MVSIDMGKLQKNDFNFSYVKKVIDVSTICKNWIFLEEGSVSDIKQYNTCNNYLTNNFNSYPNSLIFISKIMQIIKEHLKLLKEHRIN